MISALDLINFEAPPEVESEEKSEPRGDVRESPERTRPARRPRASLDLSRLPAGDAWDALPDVVKAVVK